MEDGWKDLMVDGARVIEVVQSNLLRRGNGTADDPVRVITQYFAKDGTLLAERDHWLVAHPELQADVVRHQGAREQLNRNLQAALQANADLAKRAEDLFNALGMTLNELDRQSGTVYDRMTRKERRERAMLAYYCARPVLDARPGERPKPYCSKHDEVGHAEGSPSCGQIDRRRGVAHG
jgi:hypothetical protein